MKNNFIIKSILGAILLSILYSTTNYLLGTSPPESSHIWELLANVLVATVLGYMIIHSTYRGVKLSLIVFIVYFIIGHFNILIEALIFNVTDRPTTLKEIFRGFVVALIFAPLYVLLLEKWKGESIVIKYIPRSILAWIGKITLVDFLYFIIYATAGFIIQATYPNFLDFYEGKIPPFEIIISTQFVRGVIFATVAILVLRTTELKLLKKVILVGLLFSILGAIAPLIPPNEYMPFQTRMAHGIEVGISNFLFGMLTGYLLNQKKVEPN